MTIIIIKKKKRVIWANRSKGPNFEALPAKKCASNDCTIAYAQLKWAYEVFSPSRPCVV